MSRQGPGFKRAWAALLAMALASTACIGGRVGTRWYFRDAIPTGVYGGPEVQIYLATRDPSESEQWVGLSSGLFFGRRGIEASFTPGVAFLLTRAPYQYWTAGPELVGLLAVGVELTRDGISAQLSACYGIAALIYAQSCARFSTRGWLGVDMGAGVAPILFLVEPYKLAEMIYGNDPELDE